MIRIKVIDTRSNMELLQKMKHCGVCIVVTTHPSMWRGLIPDVFVHDYRDKAQVQSLISTLLERQHMLRTKYDPRRTGIILYDIPSADLMDLMDMFEQDDEIQIQSFYATDRYFAAILE